MDRELSRILHTLGLSERYIGFYCLVSAVEIALQEPQSLTMVTKWIYPQVAKEQHSNWRAVERNIRTAIDIIWRHNPVKLQELMGHPLRSRPTATQFISFLAYYQQIDRV